MNSGIEEFFVSCTRKRPIVSLSNTNRTIVTGYSTVSINGYIGSQGDQTSFVAGKYTTTVLYKFFTDDFSIKSGDFIEYEGKTYECKGEPKNTGHENSHIRIMIEKIENIKQF